VVEKPQERDNKMNSLVLCRARGFTLLELLITIALVAVLATLSLPGMQNFFDRERLIGATEQIYSHLQQARIEAIARSIPIYAKVEVSTTGDLQYGISQRDGCVLSQGVDDDDACVLVRDDSKDDDVAKGNFVSGVGAEDLMLMSFDISEFTGVSASDVDFQIKFEPMRGTASASNEINLSTALGRELRIEIGLLGQLKICSPNDSVDGYNSCSGGAG